MSNISIPNLPSQSATTDLDLLVIVNSGETTTSKITITDFLNGRIPVSITPGTTTGSGSNSIQSYNQSAIASNTYGIAIGYANNNGGEYGGIFGGRNNTISNGLSQSDIFGGSYNNVMASQSTMVGGNFNECYSTGGGSVMVGGERNDNYSSYGTTIGGRYNLINTNSQYGVIIGGGFYSSSFRNEINAGNRNTIINGQQNSISGDTSAVISSTNADLIGNNVVGIGLTNYSTTISNAVIVPQLVMTEYASLDYADDTAAAAGGVILGGLYHNSGAVRIRIA